MRTSDPKNLLRVIAIDPGIERMGVAVLERKLGKDVLLFSDCIRTSKTDPQALRLKIIGVAVESLIKKWRPQHLAAEELFFNTNQKTALSVAEARGVALFQGANLGLSAHGYTPLEVKMALCGYGRAEKSQVTEMVKRLVSTEGKKMLDDEYDAIAVGLTFLASYRAV